MAELSRRPQGTTLVNRAAGVFFITVSLFAVAVAVADAKDVRDIDETLQPHRVAIESGDGTNISGYLYRPESTKPVPADVMLHGCSGMLTNKYWRLKSRETPGAISFWRKDTRFC